MTGSTRNRIFGGAMLVSGTCIGAGMLALPVSTAAGGFYPSLIAFLFTWIMMTASAFLMLEASLWHSGEINLISMARATLGKSGEFIAWCTYVLFLYALMTAYTAGASGIISTVLEKWGVNPDWSMWILILIFATIVYMGATYVDWMNRLLMVGLIGTYMALVGNVMPKVSPELLGDGQAKYLWSIAPLLVTSFGFHLLIPSLKSYLNEDIKSLRWAILLGSLLPLVVYLIWEILILGVIPVKGEQGLVAILHAEHHTGKQAVIELTQLLSDILQNAKVTFFARMFGLCAILTSFIGVALGLFDFFADGFHVKKTVKGKFILAALTFLPPILFAIFYPRFLLALRYAGVFAAVLLVIFPAVMVWAGRYHLKTATGYRVVGGKALVILVLLAGIAVIGLEVLHHLNMLPSPLVEKHLFE